MPDNRLSAREAALIAQAKADLANRPATPAGAQPAAAAAAAAANIAPGRNISAIEAAAADTADRVARDGAARNAPPVATAAPALDPAERATALLAAARAETADLRQRQRRLHLWVPVALLSVLGLWLLLSIW